MTDTAIKNSFPNICDINYSNMNEESLNLPSLPSELLVNIVGLACNNSKSFNKDICSIALISKQMRESASYFLQIKMTHLNLLIEGIHKRIEEVASKVNKIACLFENYKEQMDIIPSENDQRILHASYEFDTKFNLFSEIKAKECDNNNFSKFILDSKQIRPFLQNYQDYQATHNYLKNIEASLRKIENFFEVNFANQLTEMKFM